MKGTVYSVMVNESSSDGGGKGWVYYVGQTICSITTFFFRVGSTNEVTLV